MRLAWLVLPMIALAAAGCSGATKAGGNEPRHTVVLTIASRESDNDDLADYVTAVNRLSNGSVHLVLRDNRRSGDGYDRGVLADVRARKVDLATIDVQGVDELQALVAPFLVDSLMLEQKVLRSRLPERMLPRIRRLGVEGVAILPGALQRPFGLERRLLGPSDYRGAVVGVAPGLISALTVRSLGASSRRYLPAELPPWRFTGAAMDLVTLAEGAHYAVLGRSTVTANVAFGPRAVAVVASSKLLAKLTSAQRAILRNAARDALAPAIARLRAEERAEAGVLCRRDRLAFANASPSQVAALRAAVRPVYARLEQNPQTRALIGDISGMKAHLLPDPMLRCPMMQPRQKAATLLDGTWEMTATRAQASEVDAGQYRMVLRRGRVWTSFASPDSSGWRTTGTFTIHGDKVVFRFEDGGAATYRWNLYRETLTLRTIPGVAEAPNPAFAPWTRGGS